MKYIVKYKTLLGRNNPGTNSSICRTYQKGDEIIITEKNNSYGLTEDGCWIHMDGVIKNTKKKAAKGNVPDAALINEEKDGEADGEVI